MPPETEERVDPLIRDRPVTVVKTRYGPATFIMCVLLVICAVALIVIGSENNSSAQTAGNQINELKGLVLGLSKQVEETVVRDGEQTRKVVEDLPRPSEEGMRRIADAIVQVGSVVAKDGQKTRDAVSTGIESLRDASTAAARETDSAKASMSAMVNDVSKRLDDIKAKMDAPQPPPPPALPAALPAASPPPLPSVPGSSSGVSQNLLPPRTQTVVIADPPPPPPSSDASGMRPVEPGDVASRGEEYTVYELAPGQLSREFSGRDVRAHRVAVSEKPGIKAWITLPGWNKKLNWDVPSSGGFIIPRDATGVSFYSETESFEIRLKR